MSASPASSETAARARSAIERAARSFRAAAAASARTAARSGLLPAAKREATAARQQLERSGPRNAWDEHELVAARGLDEGVDRASGVTGLEERGGYRHPGRADETLVNPSVSSTFSVAVLSAVSTSPAASAVRRRWTRFPARAWTLPDSRALDRVVEHLTCFRQLSAQQLDLTED